MASWCRFEPDPPSSRWSNHRLTTPSRSLCACCWGPSTTGLSARLRGLDYLFHRRKVGQLGVSPASMGLRCSGSGGSGMSQGQPRRARGRVRMGRSHAGLPGVGPARGGCVRCPGAGYGRRPRASSRNCSTVHPAWTIIAPIVLGGMSLLPCRGIETLLLPLRAWACLQLR